MKIIHTSDWHIGQQLYGYDRTEDHLDFFRQLKEISAEEQPDALIVSGDIFDVSSPSAASMRMFTDFILELHEAVPSMRIVITSGNHDSASRIDVNRNLWRAAGIFVLGTVKRVNGEYDFSDNIVKVGEKGMVVAVPYINPAFMGASLGDVSAERKFFERAFDFVSDGGISRLPIVLMAHLTVNGCDRRGHKISQIGKVESVSSDVFPKGFDYVALGHIHRPQSITENGSIRYSGSPLSLGFDESYPHTVSVVEIGKGRPVEVREIEIIQRRELITFPPEALDFKSVLRKLKKFPSDDNSFLRLNVRQGMSLPSDCEEQATAATEGKRCRYCTIKYEYTGSVRRDELSLMSMSEFEEMTLTDLAGRFFNNRGVAEEEAGEYFEMLSEIKKEIDLESCR